MSAPIENYEELSSFDPLNDANDLFLVLDEIERRGYWVDIKSPWNPTWDKYTCDLGSWRDPNLERSEDSPTRNLAVLLAALALDAVIL